MKQSLSAVILSALALASCSQAPTNQYTINGTVTDMDGQTVVLMQGRGDTLATAEVANGAFQFTGVADTARMSILMIARQHAAQFFLEPGTLTANLDEGTIEGTPLNTALNEFSDWTRELMTAYNAEGANKDSLEQVYDAKVQEVSTANVGNPFGLMLVQQQAYDFDKAQLDSVMALCELYANDAQLQKIAVSKVAEEATSAGHPYVDIEGINATTGEPAKLSDILAEGKPVIVDFWASWCGPCRHEINEYLSQYAPQYKGKCNFVGIAVWENSIDDTKKAMEQLPISWPIIFAGGRGDDSPTTAYGINGIPEIMLVAADGTILARGLRGEAIPVAIDAALAK